MKRLDPADFYARKNKGSLWIYEYGSNIKRLSITGHLHGAKIQMCCDVPKVGQGAYYFRVPNDGLKPVWLSPTTYSALLTAAGTDTLDKFIADLLREKSENDVQRGL